MLEPHQFAQQKWAAIYCIDRWSQTQLEREKKKVGGEIPPGR